MRSPLADFDAFEAEEEHKTVKVAKIREWLLGTEDPISPRVENKVDLPVPVGTPQHAAHKIQSHKDAPNSVESRWVTALRSQAKLQGSGATNERGLYSSAPISPKKSLKTSKVRKGLPLCFSTTAGTQEILTKYDTGTMANHMSLDLAKELDYDIDYSPHSQGQFTMANGKIVTAVGRITTDVTFLGDGKGEKMTCYFNVFKSLAFPALIGMAFLHATETLSKYTSRLVDLPMDYRRSLRLCAVGEATNQVHCVINGNGIVAHADTGAEIALISAECATREKLVIEENCEELMLADGSIDHTTGFTDVNFRPKRDWQSKTVRFHVLTGLQFDILLDEDLVNDFDVFRNKACSLVNGMREMIPSLAPVIHLGSKLERAVANAGDKMKCWTKRLFTSNTESIANPYGSHQGTTQGIEAVTREKQRFELRQRINDLVQEQKRHHLWANKQSFSEAQARKEMDRLAAYDRERTLLDDKLRDLG
ncbi:hypothetical protein SLS60_003664 [Paraconiothyrium brasiliense]|uniref:Uncharacterized protein n=1 Tax=Paraconiothyrium brasiliense TaxID=300254 RepID=A0ABR3RPH0_9PLEO